MAETQTIQTQQLQIIEDPQDDFVVMHKFIPENDSRRHTDFYVCGSKKAAERLIRCIRRPEPKH